MKLASKIIDKREFETYNNNMTKKKRSPGEPGGPADAGSEPGQKKIQSPYDGIFQGYMNNKEVAGSFLREYVSEKITRHLDFDTLEIYKDSFIDKELDRYYSDVLYQVKYKGKPLLIYFLFEHKSAQERFISFQLLKYLVKIWEQYRKQNKEARHLPVIVPLVLYHGRKKWSLDTRFSFLFEDTDGLESYVPDFNYDLYDFSHIPDEKIKGAVLLRVILMTLKYAFDPRLEDKLEDIFQLFTELSDKTEALEYLEALLRFLLDTRDFTPEQLQESLTQAVKDGGTIMQTLGERFRQEGRQEGEKDKELLVVRNSLSKGLPLDIVADLIGLPVKKVKQMKAQIEREQSSSGSPHHAQGSSA